jgi:hypothetical protein
MCLALRCASTSNLVRSPCCLCVLAASILVRFAGPGAPQTAYLSNIEISIALITGANKGIGKEIARQLACVGLTVYIGSRDAPRTACREGDRR